MGVFVSSTSKKKRSMMLIYFYRHVKLSGKKKILRVAVKYFTFYLYNWLSKETYHFYYSQHNFLLLLLSPIKIIFTHSINFSCIRTNKHTAIQFKFMLLRKFLSILTEYIQLKFFQKHKLNWRTQFHFCVYCFVYSSSSRAFNWNWLDSTKVYWNTKICCQFLWIHLLLLHRTHIELKIFKVLSRILNLSLSYSQNGIWKNKKIVKPLETQFVKSLRLHNEWSNSSESERDANNDFNPPKLSNAPTHIYFYIFIHSRIIQLLCTVLFILSELQQLK
jgi:hypothetical protein